MSNRGHNERSFRLDTLAADAREGLEKVEQGQEFTIGGWLAYGHALNEGRALFPGDREFGQWLSISNLDKHGGGEVHPAEQQAAMWAAGHADQFEEARAAGNARTVRGIHAKWKEIEAEREAARLAEEANARAEASQPEQPQDTGAQSKPAQEVTTPAPQENKAETAEPVEQVTTPSKDETPKPVDPDAKLRAEYRAMTAEAQEDDWIGLRHEITELRKRVHKQTGIIADQKMAIHQLSEGSDIGKALSAKMKELGAVKLSRDDALAAVKREEYKRKKAEKELARITGEEISFA